MSRIMIFAEAVTLAHVARPIALSRVLRSLGHEVCIAAAPAADRWLAGENIARAHIDSIASLAFLRALARGVPAYSATTLKRYVEDDLRAIAAWQPDVVIGDFRLSLYISARKAGKPYGAITNAYWSRRYWTGVDAPPIAPLSWLPEPAANALFRAVYPAAFAVHALPFHRACAFYGVPPPGLDIRDVYTASDATAFADVAAFYETRSHPHDSSFFIGPLAWEPGGLPPLPTFSQDLPIAFVSLGSSGVPEVLTRILEAIAQMPLRCIVATGGLRMPIPSSCVHHADLVPYSAGSNAASFVICNGGAPAVYAALSAGKPVLAIPGNLDQLANVCALASLHAVARMSDTNFAAAQRRGGLNWRTYLERAAGPAKIAQSSINGIHPSRSIVEWLHRLGSRPPVGAFYTRQ